MKSSLLKPERGLPETPPEVHQVTTGSLWELQPTHARRLEWDDEKPNASFENLSFRLVRDTA